MAAAARLAESAGYRIGGFGTLIDLRLAGDFHWGEMALRAVLRYD
jgi:hypothetical protein